MKKLFILLFILFSVTAFSETRIVGGSEVPEGKYPWMAALLKTLDGSQFCGGAVIHPEWVLTAAHCIKQPMITLNTSHFTLGIGRNNLTHMFEGEDIAVEKIFFHENFNNMHMKNDIALLKLKKASKAEPLKLENSAINYQNGENATVMGYGVMANYEFTWKLQEVDVPLVSWETCKTAGGAYSQMITDTMVCAGYAGGGKDACQGDSGGPIVIQKGSELVQAGIVSWGDGCAEPNKYGVYTNISKFGKWIEEKTGGAITFEEVCGSANEICSAGETKECSDIDSKYEPGTNANCRNDCSGFDISVCKETAQVNPCDEENAVCSIDETKDCSDIDGKYEPGTDATCKNDCSDFDISTCKISTEVNPCEEDSAACSPNEKKDCSDIDEKYEPGTGATCKNDCSGFDISTCKISTEVNPCEEDSAACSPNEKKECSVIDEKYEQGTDATCKNDCSGFDIQNCRVKQETPDQVDMDDSDSTDMEKPDQEINPEVIENTEENSGCSILLLK